MSKLAKKFLISISTVLISVILISLFANMKFIERYYIYQKKLELNDIYTSMVNTTVSLDQTIKDLEQSEEVVIVKVNNTSDINVLNEHLYTAFLEKGLGLEKYWLWDEDYNSAVKNGRQLRIYNQGKLNYSLMIEYVNLDETFVAVAMVIPNISETIALVNRLTVLIFGLAVIVMISLVYFLVRRVTKPLTEIGNLAIDISEQKFRRIELHTNDELETLANNINNMSVKLQLTQQSLHDKNRQMETLLGNVSHDLKTPVSLIKAYATAIKDGMDDGTFIDTIIRQNHSMETMIERLLDLSRMQQTNLTIEPVDLSELLKQLIDEQTVVLKEKNISLIQEIESPAILMTSPEAVLSIFVNLLSNAIKYTENHSIKITLRKKGDRFTFYISNGIKEKDSIEANRLWEPFYVGEQSRNKELSGTGLGLSIVQAVAQKQGFEYGCTIQNGEMIFTITF